MPEITREEVRGWLQREMEINERARDTARELGLDTLALYGRAAARCRAALAALEDAERIDALAYDLEGGPIFDEYAKHDVHEIAATDARLETDERGAYCRAFRAAIDRARGAEDEKKPPRVLACHRCGKPFDPFYVHISGLCGDCRA